MRPFPANVPTTVHPRLVRRGRGVSPVEAGQYRRPAEFPDATPPTTPDAERPHFAPEHLAPEHLAPEHLAPLHLAPEHLAPERLAPLHLAPEHFAPEHFAPEHFAPVHSAPEQFAPLHLAPEHSGPAQVAPAHLAPMHLAPMHLDWQQTAPEYLPRESFDELLTGIWSRPDESDTEREFSQELPPLPKPKPKPKPKPVAARPAGPPARAPLFEGRSAPKLQPKVGAPAPVPMRRSPRSSADSIAAVRPIAMPAIDPRRAARASRPAGPTGSSPVMSFRAREGTVRGGEPRRSPPRAVAPPPAPPLLYHGEPLERWPSLDGEGALDRGPAADRAPAREPAAAPRGRVSARGRAPAKARATGHARAAGPAVARPGQFAPAHQRVYAPQAPHFASRGPLEHQEEPLAFGGEVLRRAATAVEPVIGRSIREPRTVLFAVSGAAVIASAVVLLAAYKIVDSQRPRAKQTASLEAAPGRSDEPRLARVAVSAEESSRVRHRKSAAFRDRWRSQVWFHPLTGEMYLPENRTRKFGAKRTGPRPAECGRGHCGVDMGDFGLSVHAVRDGVIEKIQWQPRNNAGKYVRIEHDDGFTSYYIHLHRIRKNLKEGMRVEGGEEIGITGKTGIRRSRPHLHFALSYKDGREKVFIDPEPVLRRSIWSLEDPVAAEAADANVLASAPPALNDHVEPGREDQVDQRRDQHPAKHDRSK